MLSGGASVHYAGRILEDARNLLALVGHQDPGTPGGKLLDFLHNNTSGNSGSTPQQLLEIGEQSVPVRCKIEKYCFSAHADMNGIILLMKALRPEQVLLVHGEASALDSLKANLSAEGIHADIPLKGQTLTFNTDASNAALNYQKRPYTSNILSNRRK